MCLFSLLAERDALPSTGIIYRLLFVAADDRGRLQTTSHKFVPVVVYAWQVNAYKTSVISVDQVVLCD